jgi:tetratricopeptide (TPR) repeat protein
MAIKHNPTFSEAYYNRGNCLRRLNRHDEALASFNMAIEPDPNNVNAINSLSNLKHERPRFYKFLRIKCGSGIKK